MTLGVEFQGYAHDSNNDLAVVIISTRWLPRVYLFERIVREIGFIVFRVVESYQDDSLRV
jgi:hypothetical protein